MTTVINANNETLRKSYRHCASVISIHCLLLLFDKTSGIQQNVMKLCALLRRVDDGLCWVW